MEQLLESQITQDENVLISGNGFGIFDRELIMILNFDLLYLQTPWWYRIMQHFIWKPWLLAWNIRAWY